MYKLMTDSWAVVKRYSHSALNQYITDKVFHPYKIQNFNTVLLNCFQTRYQRCHPP